MDTQKQKGTFYQIVVQGHLEQNWSEWFNGLSIRNLPTGETILSGWVIDQPALHGILIKVRDLGLPLISLNRLDSEQELKSKAESIGMKKKGARRPGNYNSN